MRNLPRTYIAKRLLEHGPLTMREFVAITGWPKRAAESTMHQLQDTGIVISNFRGRRTYWLAA